MTDTGSQFTSLRRFVELSRLVVWCINGDFPDALTWTGCAVVIGAGLFVVSRERAAARAS